MIKNEYELTPVEKYGNILLKRDDLFIPYNDIPLSGGKVRQCILLFDKLKYKIRNEYNNTVYTSGSANSPQSIIVTRVAKEFGFNSKVFVPMNTNIDNNILMQNVLYQGGEINNQSRLGYEHVMHKFMTKYSEYKKGYIISFGINAYECREAIIDSVSNQVKNLPDLDYLVVPCGSCIMLSGILLGIKKYNKKIKHIIGIQIAGYDRTKIISELTNNVDIVYDFILSNDYQYSKKVKHSIDNVTLDPLYESKAYDYILKHKPEILDKNTCFWLVGDSNAVRRNIYKNVDAVKNIDNNSYVEHSLEEW